jgi:hypothetical protein
VIYLPLLHLSYAEMFVVGSLQIIPLLKDLDPYLLSNRTPPQLPLQAVAITKTTQVRQMALIYVHPLNQSNKSLPSPAAENQFVSNNQRIRDQQLQSIAIDVLKRR